MQPRFHQLKNSIRAMFGSLLAMTIVSCGNKDKDDTDQEPVTQPVKQNAPAVAPAAPADPTAIFRTPNDDSLPTQAQLDQGKHSSIGTDVAPINEPDGQPNIAVKPPKPPAPKPPGKPDDQLDPAE